MAEKEVNKEEPVEIEEVGPEFQGLFGTEPQFDVEPDAPTSIAPIGDIESIDISPIQKLPNSITGTFVLEGLNSPLVDDTNTEFSVEADLQNNDVFEQQQQSDEMLVNIARTFDQTKDFKFLKDTVKNLPKQPFKADTLGEIYVKKNFSDLPKPMAKALADNVDIHITSDRNNNAMAATFNVPDMEALLGAPVNERIEIDAELLTLLNVKGKTPDNIGNISVTEYQGIPTAIGLPGKTDDGFVKAFNKKDFRETIFGTLRDKNAFDFVFGPEFVDSLDRDAREVVKRQNINIKNNGQFLGRLKSGFANALHLPLFIAHTTGTRGFTSAVETKSYFDWLNFTNAVPVDKSKEIEYGKFAIEILNGEFDNVFGEEFDKQATARWGKHWKVRIGSYLLREIGVDAALLMLGAGNAKVGETLGLAGERALSLSKRFMQAVRRSVLIGVGGGTVQAAMNLSTDQDADFVSEALTRTIAAGIGEAVIKTGRFVLRDLLFNTTKRFASEFNLKVYSPFVRNQAKKIGPTVPPLLRSLQLESIFSSTKELRRLTGKITDTLSGPLTPDAVNVKTARTIMRQTGVSREELNWMLPMSHQIFGPQFTPGSVRAGERVLLDPPITGIQIGGKNADRLFASELAKRSAMGQALGFKTMGKVTARQERVNDTFVTSFNHLNRLGFRDADIVPAGISGKFDLRRYVGEPDNIIGSISKDFYDSQLKTLAVDRTFKSVMKEAQRGLSRRQTGKVMDVLDKGSELQRIFDMDELRGFGLDKKSIDSYYAIRKTLDFAHVSLDTTMTRAANRKGLRQLNDGTIVQIGRNKTDGLSQADIDAGLVKYKSVPRTNSEKVVEGKTAITDTKAVQSVIDVEVGYLPRNYVDAKYHVSGLNMKSGEYMRMHTAPNFRTASKLEQMSAQRLGDDWIVYAEKWDSLAGVGHVSFNKKSVNLIDVADEDIINGIERAIARGKQQGLDVSRLQVVMDNLTTLNFKKAHIAPRTTPLTTLGPNDEIVPAPTDFTESAVADYLRSVSQRVGAQDWRDFATDSFLSVYGPAGPKATLTTNRWDETIDLSKVKNLVINGERANRNALKNAREAQMVQTWLKRSISFKTTHEAKFDNYIDAVVQDWTLSANASKRALIKVIDGHTPSLAIVVNSMRGVGAVTKLMLLNFAQILVQGSQIAGTAGSRLFTKPHILAPATLDIAKMVGTRSAQMLGKKGTREGQQLLNALQRSGFAADLSTTDLFHIGGTVRPVFHRLVKQQGLWQGTLTSAKNRLSANGKAILNLGAFPFRLGEGSNRIFAFAVTRRDLMEEAAKGTLKGINERKFVGAIDDAEFLQLVTNKAKQTSLNMSRAGQLEAMSGIGSVLFQFKQVLFKAGHMMFTTKDLTAAEKFGAAIGMMSLWGPTAIPFMSDLITFGQAAYWDLFTDGEPTKREFADNWMREHTREIAQWVVDEGPEFFKEAGIDKKFIERVLKKGSVNALTDGEVDIVNRVGLGKFIQEMGDVMHPMDYIVFTSVLNDAFIQATDTEKPSIIGAIQGYWENQFTSDQAFMQGLTGAGTIVSSAGYLGRFLENTDRNKYDPTYVEGFHPDNIISRTGRDTGVPTRDDSLSHLGSFLGRHRLKQYLFGLTPGPVVERLEQSKSLRRMNRAVDVYMRTQVGRYREARTSRARRKIMAETLLELQDTQHLFHNEKFVTGATTDGNWINRHMRRFFTEDSRFRFSRTPRLGE